ncbi:MAG: hypothetical protein J6K12_03225 [Clostridia bacterium]|nr:hypothetical protein [Clostridia bacterium]
MAIYRIADLNIDIQYSHRYLDNLCKNYLAENQNVKADFAVFPIQEDVEKDRKVLDESHYPTPYLESLSVYRQIARKILEYDGIILHASVVEMDGKAYAFTAPSGTGKSTHCRLWLEAFPEKARIINGDKPLIRYIDGKLYAYGTPWCGKENYNVNTKAELCSICFINRGQENVIKQIDKNEAVKKIFTQLLLPETNAQTDSFFNMLAVMCDKVKFYSLQCNMDLDAALTAYEGMKE